MSPVRSHVTRGLHLLVLLTVSHQLLSSLVMERPLPGEEPDWPFALHTWIGSAGLGILALFWMWTLVRDSSETRLSALFPWFSPARLRAMEAEVGDLFGDLRKLRRPSRALDAVASAVHGLGLTLATFLVGSGVAWLYVFQGTPAARVVLGMHKLAGNVMWAYLIGHAAMALAHQALGDDVFGRMFWTRRPSQTVATRHRGQAPLRERM